MLEAVMNKYREVYSHSSGTSYRYDSLKEAARMAREYAELHCKENVPATLLNEQEVTEQLRALGEARLAELRRQINGNTQKPEHAAMYCRFTGLMIEKMERDGVQSAETSYALFGGKEYFDRISASAHTAGNLNPAGGLNRKEIPSDIVVADAVLPNNGKPEVNLSAGVRVNGLTIGGYFFQIADPVLGSFTPAVTPEIVPRFDPSQTPLVSEIYTA